MSGELCILTCCSILFILILFFMFTNFWLISWLVRNISHPESFLKLATYLYPWPAPLILKVNIFMIFPKLVKASSLFYGPDMYLRP